MNRRHLIGIILFAALTQAALTVVIGMLRWVTR